MAVAETQVYMPQAPRPKLRLLEDERWLAFVLLVPTLVLIGMFIAYPFVRGILLSVSNARVGVPGEVLLRTTEAVDQQQRRTGALLEDFEPDTVVGDHPHADPSRPVIRPARFRPSRPISMRRPRRRR